MMIRTAGGPALTSPFDYNERKTPRFSRTTWIAAAIVTAGHVGLGAALYYQRFEMALPIAEPEPRPTIVELVRPEPVPPKPAESRPQPPNTRVNDLPAPPAPTTEVVAVTQGETVADGPTISVAEKVPEPVADVDPAPVAEPAPPVITSPTWIRQPSAEQLMRAYPDRALEAGIGGSATLNCLVQTSGRVTDCRVTRETPANQGFGRAAQGLSRHFQISPRTVNGAAEGSRVNIGIRFNPPAD